jgi:uncharacterized RmlC-like cupin family protein
VRPADLVAADPTPGMTRRLAHATERLWTGVVHTEPGAASGWHHHGAHETSIFVVEGRFRLEFGPGGGDALEAGAGDFLYVPPGVVHREANPGDEPSTVVITRVGEGPVTVNVEGPAAP